MNAERAAGRARPSKKVTWIRLHSHNILDKIRKKNKAASPQARKPASTIKRTTLTGIEIFLDE